MVRQHDAAGADPDRRCCCDDVPDHKGRRRIRDARYGVMLGDPAPMVAQSFRSARAIYGIAERLSWRPSFDDRRRVKDRSWRYVVTPVSIHVTDSAIATRTRPQGVCNKGM